MIVGIDGSNVRAGGGVTHLVELLRNARPSEHGIERVIVWGGRPLLERLPEQPWLERSRPPELDAALPARLLWQRRALPRLARDRCDLLFAPGGSVPRRALPVVTMFQNMLPFDPPERARYGWSYVGVRLRLLRFGQARSFLRSDGVICISEFARAALARVLPGLPPTAVIPHGVDGRFRCEPRRQRPLAECSPEAPLRLLYVSIIDLYKHQVPVAQAVAALRREGLPVAADFVGPAYPPALADFRAALARLDPEQAFLRYRGPASHDSLPGIYREADLFVFASSCENLPIILLEAMASGLPVASADRGPMPEALAGSGELFDPENVGSIASALRRLALDPALRARRAQAGYERARSFTWERCADRTFAFLRETAEAAAGAADPARRHETSAASAGGNAR